jgi:hypothetical protein
MTIEYYFPPLGKDSWRHPNDGGRPAPGALALTSISLLELPLPFFTDLCFGKRMQIKASSLLLHDGWLLATAAGSWPLSSPAAVPSFTGKSMDPTRSTMDAPIAPIAPIAAEWWIRQS